MENPDLRQIDVAAVRSRPKGGISVKHLLIVSVVIGLLLPVAILSAWTFATRERDVRARLGELSGHYLDLTTPAMTQAMWAVDEHAARRVMDTLMHNATIARISVKDGAGALWVESGPLPKDRSSDLAVTRELRQEGQLLGVLTLELSGAGISNEITASFYRLLAIVFFQALVAVAPVLWIMNRRVLKPLRVLGQDALKLARRDLTQPIVAHRADEIGTLAAQFERSRQHLMAAFSSLAQSRSALETELAERRKAQLALQQMAEQLEARVADRTKELSESNAQLNQTIEQLNFARDEIVRSEKLAALGSIVAGIAHELNTPVGNGLLTATSIGDLTREFHRQLAEGPVRRSQLDAFMANVAAGTELTRLSLQRAADMVAAFKQVAVDQTSSKRRRFNLSKLVQEIVLMMGPAFKATPFTIGADIADDITLDSYPGELGQVLMNLVRNSLLHGFDGRDWGSIRIGAQPIGDRQVRVAFIDDGLGILPEHLDRVFEPFFTTKLGRGGTGLGMHIVYNLVTHVLGGTINIESVLGQSTSVVMDLPLCAPHRSDKAANG